jgi:hypothetical protein
MDVRHISARLDCLAKLGCAKHGKQARLGAARGVWEKEGNRTADSGINAADAFNHGHPLEWAVAQNLGKLPHAVGVLVDKIENFGN